MFHTVDCRAPEMLSRGNVIYNQTIEGNVAKYECDPGYMFISGQDEIIISCLSGGNWSDLNDTCNG